MRSVFFKTKLPFVSLLLLSFCDVAWCGQIVYPWNATTAIVKAGETFDVWFDADNGQSITSVKLHGPYNTVYPSRSVVTGKWMYDLTSGNTYDTRISVTVPSNAPADRYDLILDTSSGHELSRAAVKVIKEHRTNYSVLHLSDTHFWGGMDHKNGLLEKRLTAIVDMANIIDPELVFHTGDNVYWSKSGFQDRLDNFLDGNDSLGFKGMHDFHAASFVLVGNHDFEEIPGGPNDYGIPYEPKTDFWNQHYGLQSHRFKYGNGRYMIINTGWDRYDYGHQLGEMNIWLNGPGSKGNLRVAAYHQSSRGKMGAFANQADVGLAMIGHNHHLGDSNPYKLDNRYIQYFALSVQDYPEFNLFRVNNESGTYKALGYVNSDVASEGHGRPTGSCRVLENNDQKNNSDISTWKFNLTLDYANQNDGRSNSNVAVLQNKFDFPIEDARVRFVMPMGAVYRVTKGKVEQQFDGDQFRIVDVQISVEANSTTVLAIREIAD